LVEQKGIEREVRAEIFFPLCVGDYMWSTCVTAAIGCLILYL